MFADREAAGERLAQRLRAESIEIDVVLGVPRGGLPVADAVARAYGVPLDVVAAKKLGAPHNSELAIGAAAADGTVWLNRDLIERLGVEESYVEAERERARETAAEKEATYRSGREPPAIEGRTVAIVDDGVATGATMKASVRSVRESDAARVIVGVPVGPSDTIASLREEADAVVVVEVPASFGAIGAHYRDFGQVTDEEAMAYLGA
ncbi:MAG: phosphoribosyltransferase [Halanaeroarchaeum sp.]